jgi:NAD(P)H-nitrite reductase large subunit
MRNYKYMIIGNSAGGVGAMEAIREIDKDGSLAVISDEEHHVYGRPLISYYLADEIDYDKIFYRPLDFYEKKGIDPILGRKALKIDFDQRSVALDDGSNIGFERLLLATGGEPFVPPIKGLEDHEFFNFITLNDSVKIRERLARKNIETAVVLGGGLIGLKAAEALTQRGIQVKVVELADRVLSPVLDEQGSAIIQRVMEEEGVEVITGRTIAEVTGQGTSVNSVILDSGEKVDCGLLIVAIGVRPRVELARDTQIQVRRGIVVDKLMQTSVPGVYACGDCAEVYDFITDGFRLTPLWPTAHVGGRVAGANMAGVEKEYVWGTGMNAVDFFGFPVISAGLINPPDGEEMEVLTRLDEDARIYRKFLIRDRRIAGMVFVNQVDRAGVALGLMREKTDITLFKDKLLRDDFGAIYLPRELREEINMAVA